MIPNEFGRLTRVALGSPHIAFRDAARLASQWQALNITAPPDLSRAVAEFDALAELIAADGAEIIQLPEDSRLTLDALYVRDASVVTPRGSVLCCMARLLLGLVRAGPPVAGRLCPVIQSSTAG